MQMTVLTHRLRANDIHIWRGERHLLRGVGFELSAGELLHVRGDNGTGKTTLLRIVAGLLRPEIGHVYWDELPLSEADDFHAAAVYAAHETALKAELTVLENLQFLVGLRRRVTLAQLRSSLAACGAA